MQLWMIAFLKSKSWIIFLFVVLFGSFVLAVVLVHWRRMFPFCILQCISFLGKRLIVRGRQNVQSSILSLRCSAIGNVSPCIILFIASLFIPTFLHAYISGFLFCKRICRMCRNKRTQNPQQGSLTVAQLRPHKNSCLRIRPFISFYRPNGFVNLWKNCLNSWSWSCIHQTLK